MMKRFLPLLASALALATSLVSAQPAAYPSQPVKWIVPYAAGGGTDNLARSLAEAMQPSLGQPLIIDNRPGASTNIGVSVMMQAKPDGYTVMQAENAALLFNEHMFVKLPYKPASDFTYIGAIGRFPVALVVHPDFPAKTVAEFVRYVKANPDKVSYASPGNGSPHHMAMELFKQKAGLTITHVPYKGAAHAMTDVMGGQVPLLWVSIPAAAQFVKAGKLKALAVSTTKRSAAFPDVPTMQEAGIADFDVDSWYAVFVPAKTPQPAIDKLNRVINTVVKEPEIRDKLLAQGSEGVGGTPEQLGKVVATELVRWQKLAKEASIKVD